MNKPTITHLKSNSIASEISHAEDCIISVIQDIESFASEEQKQLASGALDLLEKLYMSLREDD